MLNLCRFRFSKQISKLTPNKNSPRCLTRQHFVMYVIWRERSESDCHGGGGYGRWEGSAWPSTSGNQIQSKKKLSFSFLSFFFISFHPTESKKICYIPLFFLAHMHGTATEQKLCNSRTKKLTNKNF